MAFGKNLLYYSYKNITKTKVFLLLFNIVFYYFVIYIINNQHF